MTLLQLSPQDFADELARHGGRAWLVTDARTGRVRASAPWLAELAAFLEADRRDFAAHEGIFVAVEPETQALFTAFVHSTVRGQAQGGLRHWPYERLEDLLRDGLRLSLGMSRKSALAGLWWGGGKGIIARQAGDGWKDAQYRAQLYRAYGRFTTSLRGCYVTAEDVGTTPEDVAEVFTATRFVTCVPHAAGGAGNPSPATALGVACAIDAALAHRGMGAVAGKTVVVQGAGNVASSLMGHLFRRGAARILASEISRERIEEVRAEHRGAALELRHVERGDDSILAEPCDVLAPCALGGVLDPDTIPALRTPIVCGAANNQLLDEARDGAALAERGITYVPDYVANRMGIVTCANEQYGHVPDDPVVARHFDDSWPESIAAVTRRVLARAAEGGTSTQEAANALADEACRTPHPLWGHRARLIVDGLVSDRWEDAG